MSSASSLRRDGSMGPLHTVASSGGGSIDCSTSEDVATCPLCMEDLDETDRHFFPCLCDYQVCLWCLDYLRQSMQGKCPACRQPYDEAKYRYVQTKSSDVLRRHGKSNRHAASSTGIAALKKTNPAQQETEIKKGVGSTSSGSQGTALPSNYKNFRVIQRNLAYVLGLPPSIAKPEDLRKPEFFGRYGPISNVVVTRNQNAAALAPCYSAYITFSSELDAIDAIRDVDGVNYEGRALRASFGTTKYCAFFLRGLKCSKVDCFYLHHLGPESDSFTREEMVASRTHFVGLRPPSVDEQTPSDRLPLTLYRYQQASKPPGSLFGSAVTPQLLQQFKQAQPTSGKVRVSSNAASERNINQTVSLGTSSNTAATSTSNAESENRNAQQQTKRSSTTEPSSNHSKNTRGRATTTGGGVWKPKAANNNNTGVGISNDNGRENIGTVMKESFSSPPQSQQQLFDHSDSFQQHSSRQWRVASVENTMSSNSFNIKEPQKKANSDFPDTLNETQNSVLLEDSSLTSPILPDNSKQYLNQSVALQNRSGGLSIDSIQNSLQNPKNVSSVTTSKDAAMKYNNVNNSVCTLQKTYHENKKKQLFNMINTSPSSETNVVVLPQSITSVDNVVTPNNVAAATTLSKQQPHSSRFSGEANINVNDSAVVLNYYRDNNITAPVSLTSHADGKSKTNDQDNNRLSKFSASKYPTSSQHLSITDDNNDKKKATEISTNVELSSEKMFTEKQSNNMNPGPSTQKSLAHSIRPFQSQERLSSSIDKNNKPNQLQTASPSTKTTTTVQQQQACSFFNDSADINDRDVAIENKEASTLNSHMLHSADTTNTVASSSSSSTSAVILDSINSQRRKIGTDPNSSSNVGPPSSSPPQPTATAPSSSSSLLSNFFTLNRIKRTGLPSSFSSTSPQEYCYVPPSIQEVAPASFYSNSNTNNNNNNSNTQFAPLNSAATPLKRGSVVGSSTALTTPSSLWDTHNHINNSSNVTTTTISNDQKIGKAVTAMPFNNGNITTTMDHHIEDEFEVPEISNLFDTSSASVLHKIRQTNSNIQGSRTSSPSSVLTQPNTVTSERIGENGMCSSLLQRRNNEFGSLLNNNERQQQNNSFSNSSYVSNNNTTKTFFPPSNPVLCPNDSSSTEDYQNFMLQRATPVSSAGLNKLDAQMVEELRLQTIALEQQLQRHIDQKINEYHYMGDYVAANQLQKERKELVSSILRKRLMESLSCFMGKGTTVQPVAMMSSGSSNKPTAVLANSEGSGGGKPTMSYVSTTLSTPMDPLSQQQQSQASFQMPTYTHQQPIIPSQQNLHINNNNNNNNNPILGHQTRIISNTPNNGTSILSGLDQSCSINDHHHTNTARPLTSLPKEETVGVSSFELDAQQFLNSGLENRINNNLTLLSPSNPFLPMYHNNNNNNNNNIIETPQSNNNNNNIHYRTHSNQQQQQCHYYQMQQQQQQQQQQQHYTRNDNNNNNLLTTKAGRGLPFVSNFPGDQLVFSPQNNTSPYIHDLVPPLGQQQQQQQQTYSHNNNNNAAGLQLLRSILPNANITLQPLPAQQPKGRPLCP